MIFETAYTFAAGEEVYTKLAEAGATAVFAGDDEIAVGIMNGALDHFVKIPEEFEVVTANNSKLSEMVRPKLSTITQPLYDIGAVSMRLLTKLMNNNCKAVNGLTQFISNATMIAIIAPRLPANR